MSSLLLDFVLNKPEKTFFRQWCNLTMKQILILNIDIKIIIL